MPSTALRALIRLFVFVLAMASAPMPLSASPGATPIGDARQLVLVIADDWDASRGQLRGFARSGARWRAIGAPVDVALGRNGSAWGDGLHPTQPAGPRKREGDGRAPAGVFTIGEAFGYAARIDSALPYAPMQATSYCIDVPDSPLYTRIVDTAEVGAEAAAGSTEPMRRDLHHAGDPLYREGFVIEHNRAATPGHGSCIFAHLWRGPGSTTAGCTAMAPEAMRQLLAWLDPADHPLFVLLPRAEYQRLRSPWQLPGDEP